MVSHQCSSSVTLNTLSYNQVFVINHCFYFFSFSIFSSRNDWTKADATSNMLFPSYV